MQKRKSNDTEIDSPNKKGKLGEVHLLHQRLVFHMFTSYTYKSLVLTQDKGEDGLKLKDIAEGFLDSIGCCNELSEFVKRDSKAIAQCITRTFGVKVRHNEGRRGTWPLVKLKE